MWSRMRWRGAVPVIAAPGILPPAAFVRPCTSKAMMRIVAPQTGQASGRVSYDCRDAGGRAPRVGALGDAGSSCREPATVRPAQHRLDLVMGGRSRASCACGTRASMHIAGRGVRTGARSAGAPFLGPAECPLDSGCWCGSTRLRRRLKTSRQ